MKIKMIVMRLIKLIVVCFFIFTSCQQVSEKPINNVLYDTISYQGGKEEVFVENDQGRFLLKTNDIEGNISYMIWEDFQTKKYNTITFDVSGNLISNFRSSNDVIDGCGRFYVNGFLKVEEFYDKGTLTRFSAYKEG